VLSGTVEPGFEGVREAFATAFADGSESGASAVAIVGGRVVADLAGGDVAQRSLIHVYSVSKPLAAATALWLVDRGLISLEARIAEVWPEYAQGGKEATTLAHLLSHQAGLLAWRSPQPLESLLDPDLAAGLLAAEPAWWEPGTAHGEHGLLYGTLIGELVRRVDGRSLGTLFRDEFAGPWDLEIEIGLRPESDSLVVPLTDPGGSLAASLQGGNDEYRLALDNPPSLFHLDVINSEPWRRAEVAAVNAHATALGIARFYAGLLAGGELDGVRVLSEETVAAMTTPQASGPDRLLAEDVTWGLGLNLDEGGWGMGGLGGSIGWADPDRDLAVAYVTTRMGDHDRSYAFELAVIEALEAQ
jgi:CubicO group peptidase (beta-lactamase class C family)